MKKTALDSTSKLIARGASAVTDAELIGIVIGSDDLAKLLNDLRTAQKAFFTLPQGTLDKTRALQESKRLEGELDKFLKERNNPQQSLF